ncbi:hypothetical protein CORMATOL_00789 [Corynebacterium matruchotii ATCC 33806]|uniref:Uncharacterized protein n=1 Tax=Corynebacterium matruchotii ATCC 33806 TaxID=566549 RepID=C0E1D8_9CORY|nr:hypothetical protein CORMATOL_00789 [Corynebacterium matruchotii ATCC 33806]
MNIDEFALNVFRAFRRPIEPYPQYPLVIVMFATYNILIFSLRAF